MLRQASLLLGGFTDMMLQDVTGHKNRVVNWSSDSRTQGSLMKTCEPDLDRKWMCAAHLLLRWSANEWPESSLAS